MSPTVAVLLLSIQSRHIGRRRTHFYQAVVTNNKAACITSRGIDAACSRTTAHNTVCPIGVDHNASATGYDADIGRAVLNETVVLTDNSAHARSKAAQLALYVAVADNGTVGGVDCKYSDLAHTIHAGISDIQVLNRAAIDVTEQSSVEGRYVQSAKERCRIKKRVFGIPIIAPTFSTIIIKVIDSVTITVEVTTEIAVVGFTTAYSPPFMGNGVPFLPILCVWVVVIGQVDVCRQLNVLAGKILLIYIGSLCQTRQLFGRGDEIRTRLRAIARQILVRCAVPVGLSPHRKRNA